MKASRELDALIAEKVMGYRDRVIVRKGRSLKTAGEERIAFKHAPGRHCGEYSTHWTNDGTKVYCGKPFDIHFPLQYSSGIAAAWTVLEVIAGRFRRFEVHAVDGAYVALIEGGTSAVDEAYIAEAEADTAPLAICLAALKALGVEVPRG